MIARDGVRTTAIIIFVFTALGITSLLPLPHRSVFAQQEKATATPTPEPDFDQTAAVAKLRKEIKGKENEPAETVFKNIQNFKGVPAGRILAIMQFGYSRSLGVNCTHCHTPDNFAAETKPTKQIAREMHNMAATINNELLKNMKSLGERQAIVNCTTCHRGDTKPATNLPDLDSR